jgi:hypothetical protein
MILFVVLNTEKACPSLAGLRLFVDKRFETSNFDLLRDMDKIIKLNEVLTMTE